MRWNDIESCELARQLTAKQLEHPTSAKFDAEAWLKALDSLPNPTQRDYDLAVAAVHFGSELASLRETGIPLTIAGFDRTELIKLLAAYANHQFLAVTGNAKKKLKENRKNPVLDLEAASQMLVEGAGGQTMAPDDLIANLVDCLPHWLFHIWCAVKDMPTAEPQDTFDFAARAGQIVSIEHGLKKLWLNVLWNGSFLDEEGEGLFDTLRDRKLAEHLFILGERQMNLMMAQHGLDAGARIMLGRRLPPVDPVIPRTVIRIERLPSGNRKFITGRAAGFKPEQRNHANEQEMLDLMHVGLFLDESLPKSPGGALTGRDLSKAWWVLKDLARLAADDLGASELETDMAVDRLALSVERRYLVEVLRDCLALDEQRAEAIIAWFTCDPTATGRLFTKSFWTEPLLPDPGTDRCHILLAPLLAGTPVRRIEAWLERGGITDSNGIKGKGKPFERHVRKSLAQDLLDNSDLTDAVIAEHGIKGRSDSEEIDLLIRIGNCVIVGEVKCFVAPSEPLEKYNFLSNLTKATDQASKKRAWAEANRQKVASALGIEDAERAEKLEIHAVVVLNHGHGMGLERHGVPVVDLHYLSLLLSASAYQGGTRFENGVGISYEEVSLYKSQADFEITIDELLRRPIPLKRYEGQVEWRRIPFPTLSGRPFHIELPVMSNEKKPNLLRDMPPFKQTRGMPR